MQQQKGGVLFKIKLYNPAFSVAQIEPNLCE